MGWRCKKFYHANKSRRLQIGLQPIVDLGNYRKSYMKQGRLHPDVPSEPLKFSSKHFPGQLGNYFFDRKITAALDCSLTHVVKENCFNKNINSLNDIY